MDKSQKHPIKKTSIFQDMPDITESVFRLKSSTDGYSSKKDEWTNCLKTDSVSAAIKTCSYDNYPQYLLPLKENDGSIRLSSFQHLKEKKPSVSWNGFLPLRLALEEDNYVPKHCLYPKSHNDVGNKNTCQGTRDERWYFQKLNGDNRRGQVRIRSAVYDEPGKEKCIAIGSGLSLKPCTDPSTVLYYENMG
jgi:hypothetical protein